MIKVFDTVQELADYMNIVKESEYTEFNLSQGVNVRVEVAPGDSFEVYNPEHVNLMLYSTTADEMYASAGVMGDYEHLYFTCGNQTAWFEPITPAWFNVALEPSINGNHTIYYKKI